MSMILDHVNYIYGQGTPLETKALDDICLQIPHGQFVGIIGHTGSGKSTLMQHMNGLLKASSGHIYFNGEDIYDKDYNMKKLRSKVGLVFQYPEHQLFEIDVFSDVCFGPKNLGLDKKETELRAFDALRKVGLPMELYYQSPFELSGGMNQRAGIAISVLMNPSVLFADEPTSALDVAVQRQVVDELLELRELFGTAIILVTHDIGVVSAMADSVLVLQQGNKMEYGRARDVLDHPQNSYTRKLLSAVPKLRRA